MFGNKRDSDSPVIPLSPDPFGRYPSEAEASRLEEERYSQVFSDDGSATVVGSLPDRNSTLTIPATTVHDSRPPSQTPSSRFSMDSVTSEEVSKAAAASNASSSSKTSSSLMSVKSIRKLWRRSDGKRQSVSSIAQPESGRTSPNTAAPPMPNGQPAGRSRARSVSKAPPPPEPVVQSLQVPPMPQRGGVIQALRFDQESPYPIHPSTRPSISSPSPPPFSRPPSQQASRPPSTTPQVPMPAPSSGSEKGARKSILKSWKSGNLSTGSSKGSISSTGSRSSTEQQPETARKRRPSMIDIAAGAMRSSLSLNSASTINGEIPPSPALPEQYVNHHASPSRQSHNALGRPSISSNTSSPPYTRSPLMAGSPPRNGLTAKQSRPSIDSYESRPSFDSSQFEMVSPPRSSLTYPYNGLDHTR